MSWFSGTHIASWVVKLTEAQKQNREAMSLDWNNLLNRALLNYHKSLWVGVMEKMDQSLELLHHQSGNNYRPQGKVMFSEASVSQFVHRGQVCLLGVSPGDIPLVTSSGSHCSGRYASYLNAFLLCIVLQ